MAFIDTHSHVLPFIDDGAEDWDMAMAMLKQAQDDGVHQVVCTPHIQSAIDFDREDEIIGVFNELQDRAKSNGIRILLHLGAEIYIQPDLQLDKKIATLAQNGRYFLIEFPMNLIPDFVSQRFFDLVMDDKIPIVAHPERNARIITDIGKAYEFVQRGALLQANAGSITGQFGETVQKTVFRLLDAKLIHLVGSDAHNNSGRPLMLRKAYDIILRKYGQEAAYKLFYSHPKLILSAQNVSVEEPGPFVNEKSKKISDRFKHLWEKIIT
jgi:protein-tyrosine phosphatase